jgi:small-conductance mechanosensitive channel
MNQARIPIEKIEYFIQFESFIILFSFIILAFLFYKIFLKSISDKRHLSLKERFRTTFISLLVTTVLAFSHFALVQYTNADYMILKIANFVGLFSFLILITVVVRLAQIYVYLYLFFANMSQGVPRLIANLFTLLFSTFIISWAAADVFGFNVATVLATSAIFTIVLGLALQDTLGNLFSGVALQIERPFQIGDWVEVKNGSEQWIGQIQEITWRATSIIGFSDELIVIPNKTIAQSQLTIFSERTKPARFSQEFRFQYEIDILKAKATLLESVKTVPEVLSEPEPRVLVMAVTESWVTLKLFYSIKDYGRRYRVADIVVTNTMSLIRKHKLPLAHQVINLSKSYKDEEDLD